MSLDNRSKLMIASYLGGCAIASSLVGIVHPHNNINCVRSTSLKEII